MIFRYARHTIDLQKMEQFYTNIVGLEKLGRFENDDGYDGLFGGHRNSNWHLEFTVSTEEPKNKFDKDDILVSYVSSEFEWNEIKKDYTNIT